MSSAAAGEKTTGKQTRRHIFVAIMILVVAGIVYRSCIDASFLKDWDDYDYIVNNPAAQGLSLEHLRLAFTRSFLGNYAPLHILSYAIEYSLWGLHPAGYHVTNIVIHAINALLVYTLVWRLYGSLPLAASSALIFLVHPVQVESVAWASQRKNLLSLSFLLFSAIQYVRWRNTGKTSGYIWSFLGFVLSLMTKVAGVGFPLALFLLDRSHFTKRPVTRALRELLPYVLASAVFSMIAVISQSRELQGGRVDWHGGSPLVTFITMLPVMATYIRMVFLPFGLSAIYDPIIRRSFMDPTVIMSFLLIAVVLGGMIFGWRKRPRMAFWGWFAVIMIAPVCQVMPIITLMNDRYLYFPFVGIAVGIVLCGSQFVDYLHKRGKSATVFWFVCAGILIAFGIASAKRSEVWSDPQLFWTDTVSKAPGHPFARFGLGSLYADIGNEEAAVREYETLLSLPAIGSLLPNNVTVPETHARLGVIYSSNGDPARGVEHLRKAVSLFPSCLPYVRNLGFALASSKKYREARNVLGGVLKTEPKDIRVLCFMSGLSLKLGETAQRDRYREEAEAIDPQSALGECERTDEFLDSH